MLDMISHDCVTGNACCWQNLQLEITFFPICGLLSGERQTGPDFLVGAISNRKGKFIVLGLQGNPHQLSPLAGHPDLPIMKTLMRVVALLPVMTFKRVRSIFFQSKKLTVCKVKDEKEVTNFLIVLNLLKIIHPFEGKKHLRTQ